MKPTLLILAAGMGSRYGGLKQLDPLGPGGETIIDYSVYDAVEAGFGKVVFVIRKNFEKEFREKVSDKFRNNIKVVHVHQELNTFVKEPVERQKPWGTGHAVLVTREVIAEPFAVINADDYYGKSAFKTMHDFLATKASPDHFSMIAFYLKNTLSEFGTVSRGICSVNSDGLLTDVVERTSIKRHDNGNVYFSENDKLSEVNENSLVSMNFWGFHPDVFNFIGKQFDQFVSDNKENPKAEYYIPLFVNSMLREGLIKLSVLESADLWFGVTYKEDKVNVMDSFRQLHNQNIYESPLW